MKNLIVPNPSLNISIVILAVVPQTISNENFF